MTDTISGGAQLRVASPRSPSIPSNEDSGTRVRSRSLDLSQRPYKELHRRRISNKSSQGITRSVSRPLTARSPVDGSAGAFRKSWTPTRTAAYDIPTPIEPQLRTPEVPDSTTAFPVDMDAATNSPTRNQPPVESDTSALDSDSSAAFQLTPEGPSNSSQEQLSGSQDEARDPSDKANLSEQILDYAHSFASEDPPSIDPWPVQDASDRGMASNRATAQTPLSTAPDRPAEEAQMGTESNAADQIARLMALTEEVLTFRTQVEHEEANQSRSNDLFRESAKALQEAATALLVPIDWRNRATQRSWTLPDEAVAEDFVSTNIDPPMALPLQADEESSFESFYRRVGNDQEADFAPESENERLERFMGCYGQFLQDHEALNRHHTTLASQRSRLTSLEYRLQKREAEFARGLETFKKAVSEFDAHVLAAATRSMTFTPSETSASEAHPLLVTYFDRKGDVGIFRDRLMELDYNYQDGKVQREFLLDRGEALPISEAVFDKEYLTERKVIEQDLERAERDVSMLRGQCEAFGIDTSSNRKALYSDTSSLAHQELSQAHTGRSAEDFQAAMDDLRDDSFSDSRIDGWLDEHYLFEAPKDEDYVEEAPELDSPTSVEEPD